MSTDTLSPMMLFKPALPQAAKSDEQIALACGFLGLFMLLFGLTSLFVRGRLFLTSSVLAMGFGIALGPRVFGIVKILPGGWDDGHEGDKNKEVLLWFTRLVLSIQVLTSGVTLPSRFIAREKVWKSLLVLLGPVMLFATLITGAFAKLIFRVSWLEALLIGACLAPTDPVLASAVVKGTFAERHVPPYIRDLLLIESGINDGSATSFFLAPLLLLTRSTGEAAKEWFLTGILWETLFAIAAGTAIGWTFRVALEQAKKREWVDKESSLVYTAALALLTTGVLTYIDSNELLGCFCAGTALNWNDSIHTEDTHTHFSEAIDNVLDICVFLVLGTVLPWQAWGDKSSPFWVGKLVGFGFAVVFLRRLPSVLFLQRLMPMVRTGKEAMFVGHFGPMGVGAIYYALKAAEELPKDSSLKQGLYGIMAWMVFTSTIVHGVTVPSFLLGSALHPALHPKWLVNNEGSDEEEEEGSDGEQETTERHGLLAPIVHTLQRYGAIGGEDYKKEDGEKGRPISRDELHRVLHNMAGEADEQATTTKGRARGVLNHRQKQILLGEGTGLDWTGKSVEVFDEGSTLIITDETGKVSTRRIVNKQSKKRGRSSV